MACGLKRARSAQKILEKLLALNLNSIKTFDATNGNM